MLRIVVFGSGRGSNFESIVDAIESGDLPVKIVLVIVNNPEAPMIDKARENYIPVAVIPHHQISREEHEEAILRELERIDYDLICLAGYMRILSPNFLRSVKSKIINIHPSLLPSFPGLHAQKQAVDYGVKYSGCTVHVVNEDIDGGKILGQDVVEVKSDDTEETLAARILEKEHQLYPRILFDIAFGNIHLD